MKVYLETMGCQMNQLDSELVAGVLRAAGHEVVGDRRGAEAVLYNTCAVRKHAEHKLFSRLGADGQRKESGRRLVVAVMGCVAQEHGADLRKKYPQVDVVCGPGQLHRLPELLSEAAAGAVAVALDADRRAASDMVAADDAANHATSLEAVEVGRDTSIAPSRSQAYVRVMRGCDRFCTYCIVPFVRGKEQSRPPQAVVEEVRRLVDAGRTQITLLGQTVNSYRWRDGGTVRFSDLLARVSAVPGLRRLRFVTSHPLDFGDDILQAMRDLANVCPYIHCPAQSGSDAVLTRMKRGYTRAEYDGLIDRARTIVPDVVLSGDFIVGFPGEANADHAASADLIRRSGYKNSFIFKYSPRPGTLAERKYPDDVSDAVKKRRNKDLLAIQKEVAYAHHKEFVGRTVEVLVEGPSPLAVRGRQKAGEADAVSSAASRPASEPAPATPQASQLVGRTRGDHIVVFDGPPDLANRYVQVHVDDATALTLLGKLIARE